MHEMSLAEEIVALVEEAATAEQCSRVTAVWLEIGKLAAVEKDALRFCFDAVTRDSIAQGARLEIIETEGQGKCSKCGAEVPVRVLYEPCPVCDSYQIQITGGNEMRVRELEIE